MVNSRLGAPPAADTGFSERGAQISFTATHIDKRAFSDTDTHSNTSYESAGSLWVGYKIC